MPISAANSKLDGVYGDHIHENSRSHLHGGIGAARDTLWQHYHKTLLPFNQRLYNFPRGRIGKDVVNEVASIIDDILARKCNMENLMLFFPVILQEVAGIVGLADKKKHIASRLAMWREGKFKGLVEATLHSLKASQAKSRGDTTPEHRARVFDSKVKWGQLSAAVSYIADREGGGVYYPDNIDEKSGEPVGKVLRSKHPPL